MIACELCHTQNTDDSNYCKQCGALLDAMGETRARFETTPHFDPKASKLPAGSIVAERYRVEEILGEGGMGVVYRATDSQDSGTIALKILRPSYEGSGMAAQRFYREIEIAKKLDHPNLVQLHDAGQWQEASYLVMEYVDGESLKDRIKLRKKLELADTVPLVLQLLDALDAIHSVGVVHRDIKPSNVLIGKNGMVKVCDFGLAFTEGLGLTRITMSGTALGTPEYMAPEQIEGRRVDSRADIYSLGVLMYETFTGELPFLGENPMATAMQHLNLAPLPPLMRNVSMPPHIERAILKCMEKDLSRRFQSIAEARHALTVPVSARHTERHSVTGDIIEKEQKSGGIILVIHAQNERSDWSGRMTLKFNDSFYLLAQCEMSGSSTHPFVYSFAAWPEGEVFRRIVNYDDLGPPQSSDGISERIRRLWNRR